MDKDDIKRPYPMRFSANERKVLYARAKKAGVSVPDLVRLLVLMETVDDQIDFLLEQVNEKRDCARLMAALARSNVSNNLNQIAKSLHTGTFVYNPDIDTHIKDAKDSMQWIRTHLMHRQGLRKP
jgi:hypothetical protein